MSVGQIVTGDDVALPVTLTKDGATFVIDPGATVKAAVVSLDRTDVIIPAVTQLSSATGADWANSLVIVELASTDTDVVTEHDNVFVEIQVDDNGKTTWFASAQLLKGSIT